MEAKNLGLSLDGIAKEVNGAYRVNYFAAERMMRTLYNAGANQVQLQVELRVLDPETLGLLEAGQLTGGSLEFVVLEQRMQVVGGVESRVYYRLASEPEMCGLSLVDEPAVPGSDVLSLWAALAWQFAVVDPKALEAKGQARKTLDDYRDFLTRFALAELGRLRLSEITPTTVEGWVTRLLRRGVSRYSVWKARHYLKMALKRAVDLELILRNSAARVRVERPPRPSTPAGAPRNAARCWLTAASTSIRCGPMSTWA